MMLRKPTGTSPHLFKSGFFSLHWGRLVVSGHLFRTTTWLWKPQFGFTPDEDNHYLGDDEAS